MSDIVGGVSNNALRNAKQWAHLGFVAFIWLLLVPVCVCKWPILLYYVCLCVCRYVWVGRIYKFLFFDSLWSITSLPITLISL